VLLVALVAAAAFDREDDLWLKILVTVIFGFSGGIGLACLATGFGVWRLRGWGRKLQIVLAWIGLVGIPCVTLISILILRYLHRPGVRILFSGRRAEQLNEDERAELARLRQSSGILAFAVALAYMTMGGIVAFEIIYSLQHARASANEGATIADLRRVLSAEGAYRIANHGFYDNPECLSAPRPCIPAYTGPSFLEAAWPDEAGWRDVRYGHQRTFHPGPGVDPRLVREAHASPTSVRSYAFVAVPLKGAPANEVGVRGFCADDRGVICYTRDGTAPAVKDGRCVLGSCRLLR